MVMSHVLMVMSHVLMVMSHVLMVMSHEVMEISHVLMLISHVFVCLHMFSLQVRVRELPSIGGAIVTSFSSRESENPLIMSNYFRCVHLLIL